MRVLHGFLRDEQGQDLIEHTMLVAFIALASVALFLGAGGDVNTIWQSGSTTLSTAATAVTTVDPGNPPTDGNGGHGDGDHRGH
jgi:Flp pilus assembly pilin Flp